MLRDRLLACVCVLAACGDDGSSPTGTGDSLTPATSLESTLTPDETSLTPTSGSPSGTGDPTAVTSTTSAPATTAGETTDTPATSTTTPVSGTDTGETSLSPGTDTSLGTTNPPDSSSGDPVCPEDDIVCDGGTAQVCDGMGGFKSETPCADVCVPDKGCVLCVPNEVQCEGDQVMVCNGDGSGFDPGATCDPLQGLSCDADLGGCAGACAGLGLSYIGCDYYPTVTLQYDLYNTAPKDVFAVTVANTSGQPASVTITRGGNMIAQQMVASDSVAVIKLPWVDALTKGNGPSLMYPDGAYRLRSTQPVTVYQYNPLQATTTNDSSLLLPVNTWTGNYLVAAWPQWQGIPGFYAVVAQQDATKVTLLPSATGNSVMAGGGVAADGTGVVMLDEGDVLEVITTTSDLTGTIVQADKPVQVFGGHKCTNIPENVSACDHLEESLFPIETLAKEYVIAPPIQIPMDNLDKAQMVRVIASEPNTTLTFSPDQPVGKVLAKAGDFVQLSVTTAKFVVTADKKILVTQYMVGQSGGYGESDPSMVQAVNPMQWRKNYLFFAATTWVANYVDILAPKNAVVTVDGAAVGGWQPIGASNYQVAHVKLSNAGDGTHKLVSDVGVGIGVYGVQNAGSYWYPGGLDLDVLPQ